MLALAVIIVGLMRLVIKAQLRPAVTGLSGMIDEVGRTLTVIEPGGVGTSGHPWGDLDGHVE